MQVNQPQTLTSIIESEGLDINRSPGEPGGISKGGVSLQTYQENGHPTATANDIANLTEDQIKEFYATVILPRIRFDELPTGVDLRLADVEVQAGTSGATWIAELALGVFPLTNIMSDDVLAEIKAADPTELVLKIGAIWIGEKFNSPGWAKSGHGWSNRKIRVDAEAVELITPKKLSAAKPYALTWLPGVLRAVGLVVNEVPGWQTRGHGDMSTIKGVLLHHTCGPRAGNINDLHVLVDGRTGSDALAGPLCNLGLGRNGEYFMVGAGRAYHAGAGAWQGVRNGNSQLVGIEAENTGEANDLPWPAVQMDAYERGVAAILVHIGAKPIMAAGHKEYALPKGRKDDPDFDMVKFRAAVTALMPVKAEMPAVVAGPGDATDGSDLPDALGITGRYEVTIRRMEAGE